VSFSAIKKKFDEDVRGVVLNDATGFAFFVNQPVSDTERKKLKKASPAAMNEIFHLERMVHLLNSPKGLGLRLQHLGIPMAPEEQWAHWGEVNADIAKRLELGERHARDRAEALEGALDRLEVRTRLIEDGVRALPSTIALRPRLSGVREPPTASLTVDQLCWIHRIVTDGSGMPETQRGRLRDRDGLYIGSDPAPGARAKVIPLPAAKIRGALEALLDEWHARHYALQTAADDEIAHALADFHHRFFLIHPFLDGNGRVGRLLLDQAARELLGRGVRPDFTLPPSDYYDTLFSANDGDLSPLAGRVLAALEDATA
jgi:hypothetical protein